MTDGQIKSSSVGAVAVSESNPDVVYIGMGESCIRGNIMPGDGMYKSTDAGKTWTHIGFGNDTVDAISRIRVHPTNPDIVFVAVFGKYGVNSEERGVFKTTDGGKTWKKVLYRDNKTGAVDLALDRRNPNVLFAAMWEAYRVEYQMSSGGPGSGLFKSTDGGETWTEITRNPGMPSGVVGRIGVDVSGADSNRVYALVENERGGLYVSDNAGGTWMLVNENRNVRQRAFYYTHVTADPVAKDTVYMLNTSAFRSTDGGKTLTNVGGGTHGDHHDLWIDPDDPKHLVIGNDGGGAVSMAGGPGWTPQDFPTAQYYHVITTKHVPFHVCGAQQDGSTVCVPSNTTVGGAGRGGGGGGGGATRRRAGALQPRRRRAGLRRARSAERRHLLCRRQQRLVADAPRSPDRTTRARSIRIRACSRASPRASWSSAGSGPTRSSSRRRIRRSSTPRRSTSGARRTAATTGTRSARTSRATIPKTMGLSGGPITHDMNSPEVYGTVFALGPGKKDVNILWAGSDDGLVHVTRDGGKNWTKVTPKDMPDFGRVSQIDASTFEPGGAYVAVKKPLLGDFAPYIFRTRDFGKTWTKIVNGIPANDYVHAVREDPTRRGLLYAGTQHGVYISYDDGDRWQPLSLNLPDVPIVGRLGRGQRHRDRHARPQLLRPRRHRRPAPGRRVRHGHDRRLRPLQARGRHPRRGRGHDLVPAAEAGGEDDDRDSRRQGPGRADDSGTRCRGGRGLPEVAGRGGCAVLEVLVLKVPEVLVPARRQPRRRWARNRRPVGGGRGRGGAADRADGRGTESRDVGPGLPRRRDLPRHDSVGRDDERSDRAARHLPGPADCRRHSRRRSRSSSASIRCAIRRTRTWQSSSTLRSRSATRSAKPTTPSSRSARSRRR